MRKSFLVLLFLTIVTWALCSCGGKVDINNHNAVKMEDEGIWGCRYNESSINDNDEMICRLSINVYKDMSEEDMLDVLEYYELQLNAEYEEMSSGAKKYVGERDSDFICYAVFYKDTTDEVVGKYKYMNRKVADYTESEEKYFLNPVWSR